MTQWTQPESLLVIAAIGLIAGTLGGMLGVGGSTIMIPGLTLAVGYDQHLYQAAAMIANVAVSVPAAWRHRKAGAIVPQALRWMLPAALVAILLGVAISNLSIFSGRDGGVWLGRILALFLIYVIFVNIRKLLAKPARPSLAAISTGDLQPTAQPAVRARPSLVCGGLMGLVAGLLGIGGGAVAGPLPQGLLKLPLRSCIANSSAVICITAGVGALYKNATLAQHAAEGQTLTWQTGLLVGALLAPTAFVGGRVGASLTHRLPLGAVRAAFVLLMIVAAWKMAALF